MTKSPIKLPPPIFDDPKHHIRLYQGDCLELLALIPESSVDLIFADPPYFLSNGGITCHAGRMVSVNKGEWDKSKGSDANHEFNRAWLAACQRVLKPNGSLWVSGTAHIIHSVGFAMQQLGFKLLNDISWVKPNPPPNLACRYFTHATETIVIWAARDKKSRHTFNYKLMKETNRGKQMKSVWEIKPPEKWEKRYGKHPTQKPVALLERILLASSNEGDLVLDPLSGSGTTLLTALSTRRTAVGLELSQEFLQRLTAQLVRVALFLSAVHFFVDLVSDAMDRSDQASSCSGRSLDRRPGTRLPQSVHMLEHIDQVPPQFQLVQQECRFHFIGRHNRAVIFSTLAPALDDAIQQFHSRGHSTSDALFIIKTETHIFLA